MKAKFGNTGEFELEFHPSLSDFQQRTIVGIAQRSDFLCFVATTERFKELGKRKTGPITVTFYTHSGSGDVLHAWRIGVNRILHSVTALNTEVKTA